MRTSFFSKHSYCTLATLLCCSVTNLLAQDLKDVLLKMQQVYEKAEKLHVVMQVKVFENERDSKPFYVDNADIKKDKNDYNYRFANTDMLLNDRYQVVVDKQSKDILINKRDKKVESSLQNAFTNNLDSILSHYNTPALLESKGNIAHYRVFQKKGVVNQIDLYVDVDLSILNKMEYHYKDGQFVSIVFEAFDTSPSFDQNTFDENNYFVKVNGKIKPSVMLTNYRIVGQEDRN